MLIRKLFKFEGAHIVRDCTSKRCSKSQHGHSYIVEVFLTSDGLDRGQMVVDFGLLKPIIGEFIDSFDHAYSFWNMESQDVKESIKKLSDRWVEMPCSPSAESYALMFLFVIDKIIKNTIFSNGEKNPRVYSVRVHETATGYAEAFVEDLSWITYRLEDIHFSEEIKNEWKNKTWFDKLIRRQYYPPEKYKEEFGFINPIPEYQIRKSINTVDDIRNILYGRISNKQEIVNIDLNELRNLPDKYKTMVVDVITTANIAIKDYNDLVDKFDDIRYLCSHGVIKEIKRIIDDTKNI